MKKSPLSSETLKRLAALFAGADYEQAHRILVEECGNNLPFDHDLDEFELERIRFAALKLSKGELSRLREAVERAQIDSRDILMDAGFGQDVDAHKAWFPGKE